MPSAPAPIRRPPHRRRTRHAAPRRRKGVGWRTKLVALTALCGCAVVGWSVLARILAPRGNTDQTHFDAIVVLGNRLDSDGNPTPALLARITEGVHEYERGVAPRLILTGGTTRKPFGPEADVMRRAAESLGLPASAIYLEPEAMDTIQNACYSVRLMKAHGWTSAEIVTTPSHLARAAIILSHTPIQWSMHVAPPLEQLSKADNAVATASEILKTVRYLLYADWAERCSP